MFLDNRACVARSVEYIHRMNRCVQPSHVDIPGFSIGKLLVPRPPDAELARGIHAIHQHFLYVSICLLV